MIRSLCIWGRPSSFGSSITIDVIHLLRGFSFRSAIDVILWCKFHILSLKSSLFSLYWFPSGESKLWWWPKYPPDGDVVVDSFYFLNPYLYSWSDMTLFVFVLMTSLFCFKFLRYFVIVEDIFNDSMSVFPFNNAWENEVKLSVPISDRIGPMVNGMPWAWFRWWEFLSAMICSIIYGSSMILNCKLGFFDIIPVYIFINWDVYCLNWRFCFVWC